MPNPNTLEAGYWTELVGAGVTLLAVLVALFKKELVRLWRKPDLEVSFNLAQPSCGKSVRGLTLPGVASFPPATDCYILRLTVTNKGNAQAKDVQVYAASLSRRQTDGSFAVMESYLPMNLVWTHTGKPVAPSILRDVPKHCELAEVLNPQHRQEWGHDHPAAKPGECVLALSLEVAPNSKSHLLPAGVYRLDLRVAGSNSDTQSACVELTNTGNWFDDPVRMFSEGLTGKLV